MKFFIKPAVSAVASLYMWRPVWVGSPLGISRPPSTQLCTVDEELLCFKDLNRRSANEGVVQRFESDLWCRTNTGTDIFCFTSVSFRLPLKISPLISFWFSGDWFRSSASLRVPLLCPIKNTDFPNFFSIVFDGVLDALYVTILTPSWPYWVWISEIRLERVVTIHKYKVDRCIRWLIKIFKYSCGWRVRFFGETKASIATGQSIR